LGNRSHHRDVMPDTFVFDAADEQATERLGAALATALSPGTVVALCGTLGAGKTRLVQAIAAAYGIPREEVVSPTFVLCHEYHGARTIYHLDAYRLKDEDELRELGIEELFGSDAITIIEWADRVVSALPEEHLRVEIGVTGETSRRIAVEAIGDRLKQVVNELQKANVLRQRR
jgi:tRNA threonylcarbamoyladenosine biosynthesis protein TsaE